MSQNTESSKFSFLTEFAITVPKDYDHNTQLTSFAEANEEKFHYYNDGLTDKNFAKVGRQLVPGKTYLVKIWSINNNQRTTSKENLKLLEDNQVFSYGAQGASIVWQEAKDKLPKGKQCNFFDEKDNLWEDADGYHRVPYLVCYSDGGFRFDLGYFQYQNVYFQNVWYAGHCIVGLCEC